MARPQEIYTDARIELIRMFIENYTMEESDLDDPHAENPPPFYYEPDFFIFQQSVINNLAKDKYYLTQTGLTEYMHELQAEKFIVPLMINPETDEWAIVVYESTSRSSQLFYYIFNDRISLEQVVHAFCNVMDCHADNFFNTKTNYQKINVGYIDQNAEPSVLVWAGLKALIFDQLNRENPFLNTETAERELVECQRQANPEIPPRPTLILTPPLTP